MSKIDINKTLASIVQENIQVAPPPKIAGKRRPGHSLEAYKKEMKQELEKGIYIYIYIYMHT